MIPGSVSQLLTFLFAEASSALILDLDLFREYLALVCEEDFYKYKKLVHAGSNHLNEKYQDCKNGVHKSVRPSTTKVMWKIKYKTDFTLLGFKNCLNVNKIQIFNFFFHLPTFTATRIQVSNLLLICQYIWHRATLTSAVVFQPRRKIIAMKFPLKHSAESARLINSQPPRYNSASYQADLRCQV